MIANAPAQVPPLFRALLDRLPDGVVVFGDNGDVICANTPALQALNGVDVTRERAATLLPRLAAMGGRRSRLEHGGRTLGEAVFLRPTATGGPTLAEREREAILTTLGATGGRLGEAARRLGISRTTLWRRLKAYGVTFPKSGV